MPSVPHCDLSLQCDRFLIIRVDGDRAQRILPRLASIATFQKNSSKENMRVDQFGIPEYRRLQRRYRCFLIAATKIDAAAEQISLSVCWFDHHDPMELGQCFFVASCLIKV